MSLKPKFGEKVFDALNYLVLGVLCITFVFPLYCILIASFTSGDEFSRDGYKVFALNFSTSAYQFIFGTDNRIMISFFLSVVVTLAGTFIGLLITTMFAYGYSKDKYPFQKVIVIYMIIPMFFSGGLIPLYLILGSLKLVNTIWILIINGAFAFGSSVLIRNYFMTIPRSIVESAIIDGAGDFKLFFKVFIPLSKPMLATITLFLAVAKWNDWTTPMFFTIDKKYVTLQLLLQQVMLYASSLSQNMDMAKMRQLKITTGETVKAATIIIAVAPIIITYPFLQKYFIKGTMLGAVKE